MKPNVRLKTVWRNCLRTIIFLLLPFFSYSQTFIGSTTVPTDNGANPGPTTTITPVAAVANDLVVLYVEHRATGATLTLPAATDGGQTWYLATTYSAANLTTDVYWCTFNGTWTGSLTVNGGTAGIAMSLTMDVFRPSVSTHKWTVNQIGTNANSNGLTQTITGVTTTMPNTVTMGFFSASTANTYGAPTAGWTKGITAGQARNTTGSDQSVSSAYKIMATAGATGTVAETQSANTTSQRSMISWSELANDDCSGAIVLTPGATCSTIVGDVGNATLSVGAPAPTCGTPTYDIWYKFVAATTAEGITLSGLGTNFTNPGIQVLSGTCGGVLTQVACASGLSVVAPGLTATQTYYVRVFSTGTIPTSAADFSICVTNAPSNDDCATPVVLTPGTTCVTTAGSVENSSLTSGVPVPGCGTPTYDVWYKFTAANSVEAITLSSLGTNFTASGIQLLTGSCGSFSNVTCASGTSLVATGLGVGTQYFVRVYSTGTAPTTNGSFNICVVNGPVNDDCSGAVTLTPGASCSNIAGTVVNSSLSTGAPIPSCGTPTYDVWYKFTATSTVEAISLSTLGASFTNSGIQVLSGTCGGTLTTVACASGTALTAPGLTIGTQYYVRVYSTTAGASPTATGTFNICMVDAPGNDDCTGAVSVISSPTCSNTAGTLVNATFTTLTGACGTNRNDVWYSFVANSTTPSIKLTAGPSNISAQIFSGTCGSLGAIQCQTSATTTVTLTVTAGNALTIGTTYYVRVFSNNGTAGTFNLCITDPAPANNACSAATTVTSSTTCVATTGSVYSSTNEAPTITADCAGTVVYDVWYKFVAQTTNPTITLANIGTDFQNPALELLSGSCGSQTALYCGTTSISANYLTPGTTYYIRVYSSGGANPTNALNSNFDLCVVDPVATPPFNDDCANAINVPIWNTCNNVTGNMAGATLSTGPALVSPCTGSVGYDVWYKFTAVNANAATISISSLGTNFVNSGIQIFSGTCGSLTSIVCALGTSVVTPALTTNSVYYIRVFSTSTPAPNGNARFNICATTTNAPVRSGNSYVNISKKTSGGVIQNGDTLEIRFTVNHTSGTMTKLRYVDNVPTNTSMLATTNDSIRIITNEGLTYKKYTPLADGDAATYKASPPAGEYNIRLNVGFASGSVPAAPTNNTNAQGSANGQMSSSDKPVGGGGLLFAVAYRVKVTGNVGDTVTLFPGQFIYNNGTSDVTLTATSFKIVITDPLNLCANSIGLNNAVENGGTFGSGATLNRSYDLSTPISGYTFVPDVNAYNTVGDGRYAIVKNISPRSSDYRNARRQPNCNVSPTIGPNDISSCNNRMFGGFWYVDGDHSGTTNAIGNTPPDSTTPGGYMLEVNADYVASEVYRQTIHNLCPNTYYEFSAWVRNICTNCGIDSAGHQFAASTIVADQAGYPGVLPNLTFTLNSLDYYNTGEIDTLGWLKKGFVFKTDTSTSATFTIRNNAQGGGGNDWALDDIAIATCLPSMQYSPSINPMVCQLNPLSIFDTVRSYFSNYTNFKWERSVDLGNTWSDMTLAKDTVLSLVGSTYQFITKYIIPPSMTKLTNANDLYRVVVATSDSNLVNSNCLYTDASTIITLNVLDCGPVLGVDLLSFNGKNSNGYADLQWVTSKELEPVTYIVEKSTDGKTFSGIGTIPGHGASSETNTYQFTDPVAIKGKVWYRLAIANKDNKKNYSRVITLSDTNTEFNFNSVVNPFDHELDFEIYSPQGARVEAMLLNLAGNPVKREDFNVYEGTNSIVIHNTDVLPAGMYILQVRSNDKIISKKLIKK